MGATVAKLKKLFSDEGFMPLLIPTRTASALNSGTEAEWATVCVTAASWR
jgi:hypothetical protein